MNIEQILEDHGLSNAIGNATADKLLAGYTASTAKGKITGTMIAGAQVASGSATSGAGGVSFKRGDGVITGLYPVSVSYNFGFIPKIIFLSRILTGSVSASLDATLAYSSTIPGQSTGTSIITMASNGNEMALQLDGITANITVNGFTLPVCSASNTYNWLAIG